MQRVGVLWDKNAEKNWLNDYLGHSKKEEKTEVGPRISLLTCLSPNLMFHRSASSHPKISNVTADPVVLLHFADVGNGESVATTLARAVHLRLVKTR